MSSAKKDRMIKPTRPAESVNMIRHVAAGCLRLPSYLHHFRTLLHDHISTNRGV